MRTLIVSDIHSNLPALEAVIADAERGGRIDATWCLGDIVGYGPQPMECLRLLWALDAHCIMGNHDAGAIGRASLADFNDAAAEACRWNAEQLTREAKSYLDGLPATREEPPFTLVHGAPWEPLWEYLVRRDQADRAWRETETPALLVGHSHHQFVCVEGKGVVQPSREMAVPVSGERIIANPGSVGQPRDGDPRAAYALWDGASRMLAFRRVAYDVALAQRLTRAAGLPELLAARLSFGR